METFLSRNWASEATSKASVIEYANQEGSESFGNPPPLKFSILGPSVRGKQGEPHRPMLPLTGSADLPILKHRARTRVLRLLAPSGINMEGSEATLRVGRILREG